MNWSLLSVELILCGWTLILLLADVIRPLRTSWLWLLALAGIAVAGVFLIRTPPASIGQTFQDMWLVDRFALYFKGLFLLTAAVVVVMK